MRPSRKKLFDAIFDSEGLLVVGIDAEGRIVLFNPACEKVSGYSQNEVIGKYFWDFNIPDTQHERTRVILDEFKSGGPLEPFELHMRVSSGGTRLISWSVSALTEKGRPVMALGVGLDITEQKHAEEVLAGSEEHFRLLIENALDLVTVLEADATISYAGPSVERLLGYKPEEVVGRNLMELIHPDDAVVAAAALAYAIARPGVTGDIEVRILHADGSWRVHEASSFNLLDNPAVQGLVINARDVTDRKAVEEKLAQSSYELESIFQALPDLLFRFSSDGTIIDYRAGKTADLYLPPEQFLGKKVQAVLPPDVGLQAGAVIKEVAEKKEAVSFEYSLPFPEGELMYEARMMPAFEDEVIAVIRNITESKKSERLVSVQRDLAIKLSGISDLTDVLAASLGAILDITGLDCGGIYMVDEDTGGLDLLCHTGLSDTFIERTRNYGADTVNVRMVNAGDPIYVDFQELELPRNDISVAEGLRAFGAVPIKSEGRVVGCVNVASHLFDDIPQPSRDTLEILAGQLGQSILRVRLISALRDSEERYRLLHDYAGEAILTYDRDLRTISVNRRACNIIGYSEDELIGRNIFELGVIHPDDVEQARRAAGMFFSGLKAGRDEMRFLRKDGSVMIGEVMAAVLYDQEGEAIAVTNIVNDITSHKIAERALRESEEIYRVTFESTGTAMIIIGLDGTILDGNQEVQRLLGYTREEVLGKRKYKEFIHPDDLATAKDVAVKLLEGRLQGPARYEARTVRGDGRILDTLIYVSVLPGMGRSVASIIDITEKKDYERELETRAAQLRDFLDIAAHELRHPATLLEGYAEALEQYSGEMGEAEMRGSLEAIVKATSQLTSVVDDLLDISRIERGPLSIARQQLALLPMVYRAVEEMMVRGSGNRIEVDFSGDLDMAWVDPDKFLRLMVILLDNAVKYSPLGSLIEVKGDIRGGEARISVLDRGEGIPEGEREKAFERFYQSEKTVHHSTPGLGLGLYIGKRIVEAHGGRIWYDPREGGGSAFRFTLPLREN